MNNGYVYCEIHRGMYGLLQSGIIVNNIITKRLEPKGYFQCHQTPGIHKYKQRPTMFSRIVGNFGVQNVGQEHKQHLIYSIKEFYECSVYLVGRLYRGTKIG